MPETEQQLLEGQLQTEMTRQELEFEEEEESQEGSYASQLALAREDQYSDESSSLYEERQNLSSPSIFKYLLILLMFAVPNDIIDAVELTGILLILSWLVSLFLSMATVLIVWFGDSELKKVKSHMNNVENYQKTLTKTATKISAKLIKFAPKNPVAKVVAGAALEMIPFISILPWASICVFLAYLDARKTFKEAKQQSEAVFDVSPKVSEMI